MAAASASRAASSGSCRFSGSGTRTGHVFDFYKSLRTDPARLRVLGNGRQRKSYLYIGDCLDAMLLRLGLDRVAKAMDE